MAHLERVLCVGNNRTSVHLRTRTCHRQDAAYRQEFLVSIGLFLLQPELIPIIAIVINRGSHSLGIVAYTSATQGEYPVNLVIASYLDTLTQLLQSRVAHHARILNDGLASAFQNSNYLVVDTITFHTSATIIQEHDWPEVLQFVLEIVQRIFTKIQFGGIVVRKVSLHNYIELNCLTLNLAYSLLLRLNRFGRPALEEAQHFLLVITLSLFQKTRILNVNHISFFVKYNEHWKAKAAAITEPYH